MVKARKVELEAWSGGEWVMSGGGSSGCDQACSVGLGFLNDESGEEDEGRLDICYNVKVVPAICSLAVVTSPLVHDVRSFRYKSTRLAEISFHSRSTECGCPNTGLHHRRR